MITGFDSHCHRTFLMMQSANSQRRLPSRLKPSIPSSASGSPELMFPPPAMPQSQTLAVAAGHSAWSDLPENFRGLVHMSWQDNREVPEFEVGPRCVPVQPLCRAGLPRAA